MFKKTVALLTAVSLMLAGLPGGAWANEEEDQPKTIRTIQGFGDEGWAIVDIRTVTGTRVVISPEVGDEINLEEGNRYALFQGPTIYSKKINLPLLRMGVSGFQSAVFMKRANGKFALKVSFRSGPNIENRMIPIKDENDLRRLRDFIWRPMPSRTLNWRSSAANIRSVKYRGLKKAQRIRSLRKIR